jgi:hypothetical protein
MSRILDSVPSLKAIPAGQHRLLAQIMLTAFMSMTQEDEYLGLGTDDFLDKLQIVGFHVEVADHQLLISVPQ